MNPAVLTTFANPDPNASPITLGDLVNILKQLVSSEIQGSYIPYVIQHATPGVDDQDKAWIELDVAGKPIALKVWYPGDNGAWRRVYNGMIGEIRGYSGDPSVDFDKNDDGIYTAGKIGEQYDGWYLCNGLNGTPNMSDKFLLGGAMDNVGKDGYSGGWQAAITGPDGTVQAYKHGGAFIWTLGEDNLPLLSNAAAGDDPGLWIYGFGWKTDVEHSDAEPIVDTAFGNLRAHKFNLTKTAVGGAYGKTPPNPTWTTPPFVALAWIIFKGY